MMYSSGDECEEIGTCNMLYGIRRAPHPPVHVRSRKSKIIMWLIDHRSVGSRMNVSSLCRDSLTKTGSCACVEKIRCHGLNCSRILNKAKNATNLELHLKCWLRVFIYKWMEHLAESFSHGPYVRKLTFKLTSDGREWPRMQYASHAVLTDTCNLTRHLNCETTLHTAYHSREAAILSGVRSTDKCCRATTSIAESPKNRVIADRIVTDGHHQRCMQQ